MHLDRSRVRNASRHSPFPGAQGQCDAPGSASARPRSGRQVAPGHFVQGPPETDHLVQEPDRQPPESHRASGRRRSCDPLGPDHFTGVVFASKLPPGTKESASYDCSASVANRSKSSATCQCVYLAQKTSCSGSLPQAVGYLRHPRPMRSKSTATSPQVPGHIRGQITPSQHLGPSAGTVPGCGERFHLPARCIPRPPPDAFTVTGWPIAAAALFRPQDVRSPTWRWNPAKPVRSTAQSLEPSSSQSHRGASQASPGEQTCLHARGLRTTGPNRISQNITAAVMPVNRPNATKSLAWKRTASSWSYLYAPVAAGFIGIARSSARRKALTTGARAGVQGFSPFFSCYRLESAPLASGPS